MKTCNSCGRNFKSAEDFLIGTKRWRICSREILWFNCACGSTLTLPKGQYPWYSPQISMSTEAADIFNRLTTFKNIPHLPSAVIELQSAIDDQNQSAESIAEKMKQAPYVAAEVLRLANLASERRGTRIKTLSHAVTYVGRRTLADLSLAAALYILSAEFPNLKDSGFDIADHWTHSFLIGLIAGELTKKVKTNLSYDQVYIAGCLANTGKLVGLMCFPDVTRKVIAEIYSQPAVVCTWRQAEIKHRAYDHSLLGEIGAVLWGLPNYVIELIAKHHDAQDDGQTTQREVDFIVFANQIAHYIMMRPSRIDQRLMSVSGSRLGFDEKGIDDFAVQMMPLKSEMANFLQNLKIA